LGDLPFYDTDNKEYLLNGIGLAMNIMKRENYKEGIDSILNLIVTLKQILG
jgi:hypothetical protein